MNNINKDVVTQTTEWLMLNFTLPKEPSRVRVSAWRKLKKAGSINIGQSMWVLPLWDEHVAIFNGIASLFNTARDEEYKEFLDKCEDFIREIGKETEKENYNFAD